MTDKIEYKIIFSRRRSISLIVSPDIGVTVRAPYRTPLKTIERFLQEKSGWIRKHLENHSDLTRINHGKEYIEGEIHLFRGTEYELTITRSVKPFVRQYENKIIIGLNRIDDRVKIKTLLVKWYRQQAFGIFRQKVEEFCNIYKDYIFSPSEIVVKSLKSRWGSCSSKGKITLNADLIKLDERFADYVIIHELCHLKYHNHGKDYYGLLEELVPDYKSIRKELSKFITK